MPVVNNWVKNNLKDRLNNKQLDLQVTLTPYTFNEINFHGAADYTAQIIAKKYTKIFLAYSGGLDSEYVFHCLMRNKINFVPIIIKTKYNKIEMEYALHTCRCFDVEPKIIEVDDKKYIEVFQTEILNKLNGSAAESVASIIACQYAKDNDGVLIIGEYLIDNCSNSINEWDFYNEALIGNEYNVPFFFYTIEMFYAFTKSIEPMHIGDWKKKVYGLNFRPKINYNFGYHFRSILNKILTVRYNNIMPNRSVELGNKEYFINLLQPYIIKKDLSNLDN